MARYFLDTSALVKHYHQESGAAQVDLLLANPAHRFFISRLAIVELHSAFSRLVREQTIGEADFAILTAGLKHDVAAGLLKVAVVSSQRLDAASQLLGQHGFKHAIRTLDAIHLATAQALHYRSRLAALVAADKQLLAVATASGLTILDVG